MHTNMQNAAHQPVYLSVCCLFIDFYSNIYFYDRVLQFPRIGRPLWPRVEADGALGDIVWYGTAGRESLFKEEVAPQKATWKREKTNKSKQNKTNIDK